MARQLGFSSFGNALKFQDNKPIANIAETLQAPGMAEQLPGILDSQALHAAEMVEEASSSFQIVVGALIAVAIVAAVVAFLVHRASRKPDELERAESEMAQNPKPPKRGINPEFETGPSHELNAGHVLQFVSTEQERG